MGAGACFLGIRAIRSLARDRIGSDDSASAHSRVNCASRLHTSSCSAVNISATFPSIFFRAYLLSIPFNHKGRTSPAWTSGGIAHSGFPCRSAHSRISFR